MPDIDFAFLADAAETIPGQKFHVLGGGIARIGGRRFPLRHPHLALVIGLPIGGAWKFRTITGEPWYTWPFAIAGLVAMSALLIAGLIAYRRNRAAIVGSTVLVLFVAQAWYIWGYSRTDAGVNDMRRFADIIWKTNPDALIYSSYPGDLYCHISVETPVKLTEHQRKLLKELDESLKKGGARHSPSEESWADKLKGFFSA